MLYSLTTTPLLVLDSRDYDRVMMITAGAYSTATSVYLRIAETSDVIVTLNAAGVSSVALSIPSGVRIEAYTDAGTAKLSVFKPDSQMGMISPSESE